MAITYSKLFEPAALTAVAATLYTVPTVPGSSLLRGGRMRLTNTSGTPKTGRLYAVPAGQVASDTYIFFSDQTVPAFGYVDVDIPILAAGDYLQALANGGAGVNAQLIAGGVFSA
jgi:hypothetical protein